MELTVKKFDELNTAELYSILRARAEVFVVEQNCVYQDLDGKDLGAYHVMLCEGGEVVGYLRVIDRGISYDTASIGRVITTARGRGKGLGYIIINEGIRVARECFGADAITISAQCQARGFYEKFGFKAVSEQYLEDDIPHVRMVLEL